MLFWCVVGVGAVLAVATWLVHIRVWIADYSECED